MKVVAAVIVRGVGVSDSLVLAAKRSAARPHPGKWEFPGGKVENGEGLEDALRRELREELGIPDARIGRLLWRSRHRYPGREPIELSFFLIREVSDEIQNLQFEELRWAPVGELGTLDFLEGDRAFLAAVAQGRVSLEAGGRVRDG